MTRPVYADGSALAIRDEVLLKEGRVTAVVRELIQHQRQIKEWAVDEPGVLFESPPFGLLLIRNSVLAESPPWRIRTSARSP